uniref:hypothetical protein n=1 Tax=Mesorhizobium amorphae TaxID=71433 RepID=UPI001C925A09
MPGWRIWRETGNATPKACLVSGGVADGNGCRHISTNSKGKTMTLSSETADLLGKLGVARDVLS